MPPYKSTAREALLLTLSLLALLYLSASWPRHSATVVDYIRSSSLIQDHFHASPLAPDTPHHDFQTVLHWQHGRVPETKIVAHVPGWTIFDRLYLLNGTLYVVADDKQHIPERHFMTSTGIFIENTDENVAGRNPTDKEMRIISVVEAHELFGADAVRLDGVSWLSNDPKQFITHYYHWSAELLFGFWRAYSSLDPSISPSGETFLPAPRRLMFVRIDAANWRDYAAMNQWVLRSAFPSISTEFMNDWKERIALNRLVVFDRVVLADRAAAMNGEMFLRTQRTAANAFALPGSASWWVPVRNNVIGFSLGDSGAVEPPLGGLQAGRVPVITYISRQGWNRRMLLRDDHERLVNELHALRDEYGYEVNVVEMDKLSRIEQFRLAGRTTIMMGVHGNGLTALVWMRPTPRATVMEFFYPGGFAHDYEYTTRALGMVHYGFWNDKHFTRPNVPPVNYNEGFQGNEIPIDGAAVAKLCRERLTLAEEMDD